MIFLNQGNVFKITIDANALFLMRSPDPAGFRYSLVSSAIRGFNAGHYGKSIIGCVLKDCGRIKDIFRTEIVFHLRNIL